MILSSVANMTSVFHALPSCDGCLVLFGNTTVKNMNKFLEVIDLKVNTDKDEFTARSLYLMGRQNRVRERT